MFTKRFVKAAARMNKPFMPTCMLNQARRFAVIRKFTETHEWVEFDTDTKLAKIGVTDHAQNELGEVVYVELPEPGTEFTKGDVISTIESTKTAADIY